MHTNKHTPQTHPETPRPQTNTLTHVIAATGQTAVLRHASVVVGQANLTAWPSGVVTAILAVAPMACLLIQVTVKVTPLRQSVTVTR